MFELVFWLIALTVAITIHEAAHAFTADRLGDPTAKLTGRLSLNPISHYDPIGTTILLVTVVLRALGAPVIPFGWAKPVGFDPFNLKNPRKDSAIISLSGPLSNLVLAVILSLVLRVFSTSILSQTLLSIALIPIIIVNVSLAVFNLIPIYPLDGEKIITGLLPQKDAYEFERFMQRFGTLIIFFLIFPTLGGASPISRVISPIIDFLLKLLVPIT